MKKVLLIAAFAVFGMMSAQAQEGFRVGANVGFPIGDAGDVSSLSAGVDFSYLWNISGDFDLGVATGYTNFFGKKEDFNGGSFTYDDFGFIPVAAAARYSFNESWFVAADLGYAVSTTKDADGGFYYQPKVGWHGEAFEVFAFYKGISISGDEESASIGDYTVTASTPSISLSAVGIGAAYKF